MEQSGRRRKGGGSREFLERGVQAIFPPENAVPGKPSANKMRCPGTHVQSLLVGDNQKLPVAAAPRLWSQKEHLQ